MIGLATTSQNEEHASVARGFLERQLQMFVSADLNLSILLGIGDGEAFQRSYVCQ